MDYSLMIDSHKSTNADVTIAVYDMLGNEVGLITDEYQTAGIHMVAFDAHDLPDGIYIASLNVNGVVKRKKMVKANRINKYLLTSKIKKGIPF